MDAARHGGSFSTREAKDEWWDYAVLKSEIFIDKQDSGDEITGDDIHETVGVEPPVPNIWGPLTKYLAETLNLIRPTGRYVKSRLKSNNATRAAVWRVR